MTDADPLSLYERLMAVKPATLNLSAWSRNAGVNPSVFTDIRRRGRARHDTLEKLLRAIGVTFAEFEAGDTTSAKDASTGSREAYLALRGDDRPRDIPVQGTADCADLEVSEDGHAGVMIETMALLDEVIDYVRRPASLDHRRDVYAFYYRGTSMEPRYEEGELGYADPKRMPVARDYAVVQLRGPDGDGERVIRVLAKRIVRISATFVEMEQFNPQLTFRVERRAIMHMHRIIPWAELVAF